MEVDEKRSKGGFLNLFDWHGKSRKKLFPNTSNEIPGSKQEKENSENYSELLQLRIEVDENEASSSNKESRDLSCSSWAGSDEGCGTRAPGVVARLMGLDSLPTLNIGESSSPMVSDSYSFRTSHHHGINHTVGSDFYSTECVRMVNKLELSSRNPVPFRPQRMQNRQMERFQTEVLPPKSAKSIPITRHKLLSPIKSPGFIPTKNVAYVMEVAAQIIEASPQASAKCKVLGIGPSVPLGIRVLQEKMETSHKASRPGRTKEGSASKCIKRRSDDRSPKGSDCLPVNQAFVSLEKGNFNNTRNKGKPESMAVQANVNVQRREALASSGNRSSVKQREQNEAKSSQFSKCQQLVQRPLQKRTSAGSCVNVLRQNNQKQNGVSNKDKLASKTLISNQPVGRTRSHDERIGQNKTFNKAVTKSKIGYKKTGSAPNATQKDISFSTVKGVSRKKRLAQHDVHLEETIIHDPLTGKEEGPKCNVAMDGCINISADKKMQGMDVISFTFTSPLKRSVCSSQPSSEVIRIGNRFDISSVEKNQHLCSKDITVSSPKLNVIGGDSLSVLLEQKLQELSCKVQTSKLNIVRESSPSSLQDSSDSGVVATISMSKQLQLGLPRDKLDHYDCLSVDGPVIDWNPEWQEYEGIEQCSGSSYSNETGKELDMPKSIFEPSFESARFAYNRSTSNGIKKCTLDEAQTETNLFSRNEFQLAYGMTESPDTTSSSSKIDVGRKQHGTATFGFVDLNTSGNWELEYVKYILKNAELALEGFALGNTKKIIAPNMFDILENQQNNRERKGEECWGLQRKVLFDYMNESLHLRCRQMQVGAWSRWPEWCRSKDQLAKEMYKEILDWKSMRELMVDELVERDMSSQYGKWLDFKVEAFEEGLDIEKGILTSLVDELVSDLLIS